MPSFADLKAKAVKAKDVSVSKIQTTVDRNTSVPMKKTNWDPYSGTPAPPPPPPRVNSNSRPEPSFLPPPSRTTSSSRSSAPSSSPSPVPPPAPPPRFSSPVSTPAQAPRPPPRTLASSSSSVSFNGPPPVVRSTRPDQPIRKIDEPMEPTVDWANLSAQDKEVFFSWLDEYFSRSLNIEIPSRR